MLQTIDIGDTARRQLTELLDGRLDCASAPERARILIDITDLFLCHSETADAPTIALFDEVFLHLIVGLDTKVLVALSAALAPFENTPARTLLRLAQHADVRVAAPILAGAKSLAPVELTAIASAGSQDHLLAICARARINEKLSAILVARGERPMIDRLLMNPGVRFAVVNFRAALPRATADSRGRIAMRQPALVLDAVGRPAGRCVTLDVSPGGLKLQVGAGAELSDLFKLELPNIADMTLECRLAWRLNAIAGLQFTAPLADQLATASRRH